MTLLYMIALRNKTVVHAILSFDSAKDYLRKERLTRFRNFASIVTWRHTSPLAPATSYLLRGRPFNNSWGGGGLWMDDFEKKFPASACRKQKIACSTTVIESLWEKKGKKYPAHQIARKKKFSWPEITHPTPQELNSRPLKGSWTGTNKSYQLHLFRFVFSWNFLCSF